MTTVPGCPWMQRSTTAILARFTLILLLVLWVLAEGGAGQSMQGNEEVVFSDTNDENIHDEKVTIQEDSEAGENLPTSTSLECGIWLAPSAIRGAGLGMYAGRDFQKDEPFQVMGDPVIPIVDIKLHNEWNDFSFLWDEYTWTGDGLGCMHEGTEEVSGASPGFGSAANSYLPLVNVAEGHPDPNTGGLSRARDPGVGAFTVYKDRESTATRDIKMGEELYVDYSEAWFEGRPQLGPIPLKKDLKRASRLFQAFQYVRGVVQDSVSAEIMDEVWNTFVRHTAFSDSRVIGSFDHNDPEELAMLEKEKPSSLPNLRKHQATRTAEWLEDHGTCADHLYAGPSTLKQAGQGAFASRDLPAGTLVAQIPLIHIPNRDRLLMFTMKRNETSDPDNENEQYQWIPASTERTRKQLLWNYCYGHSESTLLLCPYGPMVNLLNHNRTQANVEIRWGDPERGNHMPHLLRKRLEVLEKDATAKLAFELVATRDIPKDTEVFLDYGENFEAAWQHHVESWIPVEGAENYASAWEANNWTFPLRTAFEQLENPYSENLQLKCHKYFLEDEEWEELYEEGTLEDALNDRSDGWVDCDILRRAENEENEEEDDEPFYYTAVYRKQDGLVEELPRLAFRFFDSAYSSDMFLGNAFRHEIGIPDTLFPQEWRNLQQSCSSEGEEGSAECDPRGGPFQP